MMFALLFYTFGAECWRTDTLLHAGAMHIAYFVDVQKLAGCISSFDQIRAKPTIGSTDHCSRCNYLCSMFMAFSRAANGDFTFFCPACTTQLPDSQSIELAMVTGEINQCNVLRELVLYVYHTTLYAWVNLPTNLITQVGTRMPAQSSPMPCTCLTNLAALWPPPCHHRCHSPLTCHAR